MKMAVCATLAVAVLLCAAGMVATGAAAQETRAAQPSSGDPPRRGKDFCITCWQERPKDGKVTCWNVNAPNLLIARLRGDLICAANFINPYYLYQRGKCETKTYCGVIK